MVITAFEPPEFYINALVKTITKNYNILSKNPVVKQNIHDTVKSLFTSKNPEPIFSTLLKTLKRTKNPEGRIGGGRINERISNINNIFTKLSFDTTNMKVLDIGAGKGEIITALQQFYHLPKSDVYAIDQKLPNIKNITALIYDNKNDIPLPDHSIDVILLFAVLHHIPPDIRIKVMNEIERVIAPGGIVIIREHDDIPYVEDAFYLRFIELIHMFWYLAENELEDPLYLMTYNDTAELFKSRNFKSVYVDYYKDPNPQRLYHEAFQSAYDDFPYHKYSMDTKDIIRRFNNLKKYKFETVRMPYTIKNIPCNRYKNKK